jgi:hypothetical protein
MFRTGRFSVWGNMHVDNVWGSMHVDEMGFCCCPLPVSYWSARRRGGCPKGWVMEPMVDLYLPRPDTPLGHPQ